MAFSNFLSWKQENENRYHFFYNRSIYEYNTVETDENEYYVV